MSFNKYIKCENILWYTLELLVNKFWQNSDYKIFVKKNIIYTAKLT